MRHNGAVTEPDETPFITLNRDEWSALAASTPLPLTEDDIARVRGLGDPIDLGEVDTIYRPLSRLLDLYSGSVGRLHDATSEFLGERAGRTPFVIGVAGSVAVGESTSRACCANSWRDGRVRARLTRHNEWVYFTRHFLLALRAVPRCA